MPVKPVPDGYSTITPYIMSADPGRLITFLKDAFGGELFHVSRQGDGKIIHAQVRILDSVVMVGGADSGYPAEKSSFYLYLNDVDKIFQQALDAGAEKVFDLADQIHGDRMGGVKDPTGNTWWLAAHIEEVTEEEMARRFKQRASGG
jgi:uncharacterized glyoxalase superfamily protein PhnB